jgi:hypothetical protein
MHHMSRRAARFAATATTLAAVAAALAACPKPAAAPTPAPSPTPTPEASPAAVATDAPAPPPAPAAPTASAAAAAAPTLDARQALATLPQDMPVATQRDDGGWEVVDPCSGSPVGLGWTFERPDEGCPCLLDFSSHDVVFLPVAAVTAGPAPGDLDVRLRSGTTLEFRRDPKRPGLILINGEPHAAGDALPRVKEPASACELGGDGADGADNDD